MKIDHVMATAAIRKSGYVDEVFRVAVSRDETYLEMSDEDYLRIRAEYAVERTGPGTELKKLLSEWPLRIKVVPGCKCNNRAVLMDARGCDWCEENIETIVGWLREEATKRKLPFLDAAGRLLVKRAIRNARKAARKAARKQR